MGANGSASYQSHCRSDQQPAAADGGESVSEHSVVRRADGPDPVVVSLLRNRIRFAPEVVAQAVIELEHTGRLRVEPNLGNGRATALLPPSAEPGAEASPGESAGSPEPEWLRLVLERLRSRAVAGVPTPLSVLTTVDGVGFWEWRSAFEQALTDEARRARLIERRLTPGETIALVCTLTAGLSAAVGTLIAVLLRPSPGFGAALATALFGFILFSAALGRLAHYRLSEAGRLAVRRAEDESAAGDAAARARESAIQSGINPLPKDHVWSSHGGAWRTVGLGSRFGDTKRLPRQVREALPDRRVLACQVVKRWYVPNGRERDPAYCAAFDDGASSFTWTFDLTERAWQQLSVGEVVLVDFSPRRHKLHGLSRPGGPEL